MMRIAKVVVAALALSATTVSAENHYAAPEMRNLWNTWKQIHNKAYSEVEELKKFTVFVENYFRVVSHNAKNSGFRMALNQFADMTKQEFKAQHLNGLKINKREAEVKRLRAQLEGNTMHVDYSVLALPASVDWRTKGAVTPVKNQAQCGSCWAFSSTGALEGLNFIKAGKLESYSEQQLVDCDRDQDQGCNGGLMDNAFTYTAEKGIELESDYPYKGVDGTCKYDAKKAHHVNKGFKDVTVNDPEALKAAIVAQPVSVAIEADEDSFQFYSSGVIKSGCGAELDHGVLAVGYTTINGDEAFIVKNSWASSWGDKGYVHISTDGSANNGAGVCGILSAASYPTA